ncbi:MAG: hypothetical protein IPO29_03690 [Anaerolineae bacterium]|nr:hypothetical protein [Anaerolineae bacterium]
MRIGTTIRRAFQDGDGTHRTRAQYSAFDRLGRVKRWIARCLHLTEGTVKWYAQRIFAKLGARNRVGAIRALGDAGKARRRQAHRRAPTRPRHLPETVMGRDGELAEALSLLRANRLVTLLAPGGMGKSTLARAIAEAANAEFPGGLPRASGRARVGG